MSDSKELTSLLDISVETDCMNLGTYVVISSFKSASLNPNTFAYDIHLFGRICASQRVTKIERKMFSVVHAISQRNAKNN